MADRFRELLKNRDYIIFDGAIKCFRHEDGETPEVLNITRPSFVSNCRAAFCTPVQMWYMPIHLVRNRYVSKNAESVEELVTAGIVNAAAQEMQ